MPPSVLILNSEASHNRGDRAILAGNIQLIRERWPNARITALSDNPERDSRWYGIRFLPYAALTLNPLGWLAIAREARQASLVFWGGGEMLKGYTNLAAIFYWLLRTAMVRLCTANIVGLFQGIGRTDAAIGRRAVVSTVNLTRVFLVRDAESAAALQRWGATVPVRSGADPALLPETVPLAADAIARHAATSPFTTSDVDGCIGVALRRWFHYRHGGLLPHRYRVWERTARRTIAEDRYLDAMAALLDTVVERTGRNVVFLPMFNTAAEADDRVSVDVLQRMRHGRGARVLAADVFSPSEFQSVVARCRFVISVRLHAAIVAASAGVPAYGLYYVDKGRQFFTQLGMQAYARPLEDVLDPERLRRCGDEIVDAIADAESLSRKVKVRVAELRNQLRTEFSNAMEQFVPGDLL